MIWKRPTKTFRDENYNTWNKNTLSGINSIFKIIEEKISEPEVIAMETT